MDLEEAGRHYRKAADEDPKLGEAWWGVAQLETERGDARAALTACREAKQCQLTRQQQAAIQQLEPWLARYARTPIAAKN
jgi:tetratricopeptide (TPR) repeat protein